MAAKRTERLMNLVIALLHTPSSLTAEQIRAAVTQYGDAYGEAFKRMLERDKAELRDLGIPLTTVPAGDGSGESYRIARPDYQLPPIELAPEEAAAVALAARSWRTAALGPAASRALAKVSAGGVARAGRQRGGAARQRDPDETEKQPDPPLAARVDTPDPSFEPLLAAVREPHPVRFDYRSAAAAQAAAREVEPWGMVSWHGHWYVAGHDRDRNDLRVFRLSRVTGPVRRAGGAVRPAGELDLTAEVARTAQPDPPEQIARLWVRVGRAADLRREGRVVEAGEGWETVEVGYADLSRLVDRIAWYGADVVVDGPPQARAAMTAHWEAIAGALGAARTEGRPRRPEAHGEVGG